MYVSITGLKTKRTIGATIRLFVFIIPAFRTARKADDILLCEGKSRNGYASHLTVWEKKNNMLAYKASPIHMEVMKVFSNLLEPSIAIGYETNAIPS